MPREVNPLLQTVEFDEHGLVPVIVQDHETKDVLMLAYMNEDTLRKTLETGQMTYWSRSRQEVWVKGARSGNVQIIKQMRVDCDGDALLFDVEQKGGAACHTGHRSCFHRAVKDGQLITVEERVFDPDEVYGQSRR